MKIRMLGVVLGAFFLSGCSLSVPGVSSGGGSVWKSSDAGKTFESKVTVDEKRKIASADVLSFVFHPTDSQIIYMGTLESGLFKTTDGAEHWTPLTFPPTKIYGLTIDQQNGDRLFASGIYNDVGKIYRTEDAGANWTEVYAEPGPGSVITALAAHPANPNLLYAGTSNGVVIKSMDGGMSWENLTTAKGPVTKILLDRNTERATLLVFGKGVMVTENGGRDWSEAFLQAYLPQTGDDQVVQLDTLSNMIADRSHPGTFYGAARNGVFRSRDSGKTWESLPIIESSRKFPVRSVAVNPVNGNEIVYVSGATFYKSVDGGTNWSTTQLSVDRGVSVLEYEPGAPEKIYFGLRKF